MTDLARLLSVFVLGSLLGSRLAAQNTLNDFPGDSSYDLFGRAVAGVGDVNGDGVEDVLIGAPGDSNNGSRVGYARVHSGLDGSTLHTFSGQGPSDQFGSAVGGAGDVDADGHADLIVGSYFENSAGLQSGSARVYSGLDGSLLHHFQGLAAGDYFGSSVCGIGDVDADGFDDVAVGAPYSGLAGSQAGYVQLLSGQSGNVLFTLTGGSGTGQLGACVASAGDVDGDGTGDVIAGAPQSDGAAFNAGRAYVFSGATGAVLLTFEGDNVLDILGTSVAGGRDVNADGTPDLLVGMPGVDSSGNNGSGRARVFSGATGLVLHEVDGDAAFDRFANAVTFLADVDSDTLPDFAVGAPGVDTPFPSSGSVRVFSGASGQEIYTIFGEAVTWNFGSSLADAGDADQDGFGDFIAGAVFDNPNGGLSGSAQHISGAPNGEIRRFCTAAANSTGVPARLNATGSARVPRNDLVLIARDLPSSAVGIFFYGPFRNQQPFGEGFRCVGGHTFRLEPPESSNASGVLVRALDLTLPPANAEPGGIDPGDLWKFQCWYRDPAGGPAGFNLTDALAITFAP